jgi:MurNAc alpha-1-phosphate uridylyltransferase
MKCMILAAGRGDRMRPLTDTLPKPLIPLKGRPLIEYPLRDLAEVGIKDFVINLGWLGEKIPEALGDGSRLGVRIKYSDESWPALETGGGIFNALRLLGPDPFVVVNADVYAEYPWFKLAGLANTLPKNVLAHLVLVPNPEHLKKGDFMFKGGRIVEPGEATHTFSGISILRPVLFSGHQPGKFPLAPLLRAAARAGRVTAEVFNGLWSDVGTPERLAELEKKI